MLVIHLLITSFDSSSNASDTCEMSEMSEMSERRCEMKRKKVI